MKSKDEMGGVGSGVGIMPIQKPGNIFAVLAWDLFTLYALNFLILSRLRPLVATKRFTNFGAETVFLWSA
jgi:hypothetical protein